jgi:hypothetical protein
MSMACSKCGDSFFQPAGHRGHPLERCENCRTTKVTKPEAKTCPECAVSFIGGRTRVYCSPACRNTRLLRERTLRREVAQGKTDKHCTKCDRTLPVDQFRKDRKRVDGIYPWCRDCWRDYMGTKARTVKSQTKAEYDRDYRRANKDRIKDEWFASYLWTTYRMTEREYDALLEVQGHACAICSATTAGAARGRSNGRFSVDHDHACCPGRQSCGKCVRGLLCRLCNTGIGSLKDDERTLRAAIQYLRKPKPVVTQAERDEQLELSLNDSIGA